MGEHPHADDAYGSGKTIAIGNRTIRKTDKDKSNEGKQQGTGYYQRYEDVYKRQQWQPPFGWRFAGIGNSCLQNHCGTPYAKDGIAKQALEEV